MEIKPENYEAVTDVSLRGSLYMSQAVVPHMRERKSGSIICLSSVSAQRGGGIFGGPHYSAAKAGVLGLAKAMARELGPDGIRVNSITPGLIQTDITAGKLTDDMKRDPEGYSPPSRRSQGCRRCLSVSGLRPVQLHHGRRHRRERNAHSLRRWRLPSPPAPLPKEEAMEAAQRDPVRLYPTYLWPNGHIEFAEMR